jgi:hypothetical protein
MADTTPNTFAFRFAEELQDFTLKLNTSVDEMTAERAKLDRQIEFQRTVRQVLRTLQSAGVDEAIEEFRTLTKSTKPQE